MKLRNNLIFSLPLSALLGLSACGDDGGAGGDETAGSETDGTETGDPTTTTTTTTTGDGDGDPTTGDGDGDGCVVGSEGCPCTAGGGCDPGLVCDVGVCTPDGTTGDGDGDPTTGDGDGDPTTGDGDGDPTTGDGDGDPNQACVGDEFIEIDVTQFADADGWDVTQSMILMGQEILAWDQMNDAAFVTWDIDVPCDDTWHVWVRAINQGQNDSFFATVDGAPDPAAIFEIGCDQGPQQAAYQWRELNYREQGAPGCEYLFDPWTQDWATGTHQLTLTYRESYAIADVWVTNTDMMPQ